MILLERYGWFQVVSFPKCCSDVIEGKMDELVVQLYFISAVKTNILEGDSSDAYSKKSCDNWNILVGHMCRELEPHT